jgi:hypothetical protein
MSKKKTDRRVVVPPEFEDTKNPDYKYVYANGVFGGLDPNGGRMIFYLDRLEPETVKNPPYMLDEFITNARVVHSQGVRVPSIVMTRAYPFNQVEA